MRNVARCIHGFELSRRVNFSNCMEELVYFKLKEFDGTVLWKKICPELGICLNLHKHRTRFSLHLQSTMQILGLVENPTKFLQIVLGSDLSVFFSLYNKLSLVLIPTEERKLVKTWLLKKEGRQLLESSCTGPN